MLQYFKKHAVIFKKIALIFKISGVRGVYDEEKT